MQLHSARRPFSLTGLCLAGLLASKALAPLNSVEQKSNDHDGLRLDTSCRCGQFHTNRRHLLKIIKRTESPFRDTPGGMVLVATRVASQPPQFPPIEFVHDDQKVEEIELGPTGSLYSFTIVHPARRSSRTAWPWSTSRPAFVRSGDCCLATSRPPSPAACGWCPLRCRTAPPTMPSRSDAR
jgi:uncharacterized protein